MKKKIFIIIFYLLIIMQILQEKSYSISLSKKKHNIHRLDNYSFIRNENDYLFKIRNIYVIGKTKYDSNFISKLSNLYSGNFINTSSNEINKIIEKLWKSNLFQNITIYKKHVLKNNIDIYFELEDLIEIDKIKTNGIIINEFPILRNIKYRNKISNNFIQNIKNEINEYFKNKGYHEISIKCKIITENGKNILFIDVNKGEKIGIKEILFEGNKEMSREQLLQFMKKIKNNFYIPIIDKSIYVFVEKNIEEDIKSIIDKYKSMGFIDVQVFLDSVWKESSGYYSIKIKIIEGDKYFIGNVKFIGNKNINTNTLKDIFFYKKGDVYDLINIKKKILDKINPSILYEYLNSGFLYVKIKPIERVINNKIYLEIQIEENNPVYIHNVKISGNSITKDHVIKRELTTHEGELFSTEKIKRSLFNLENLNLFNKVYPKIYITNERKNSVDIEWCIVEKNTNEIQFHGGFDGKNIKKFIGDFRINFNNFSLKNFFNWRDWKPIPQGENQKLVIFSQLGRDFSSYGFTFTEPWIGKINPASLTLYSRYSLKKIKNNDNSFFLYQKNDNDKIGGIKTLERKRSSIQIEKFVKFLDPYSKISFLIDYDISSYKKEILPDYHFQHIFSNISSLISFQRTSIKPNFIFPIKGSKTQFDIEFTPPYSIFINKNNDANKDKEIDWIEYSKLRINTLWYKNIIKNMVLKIGGEFGCLGTSKKNKLYPFQKFYMGEIPNNLKSEDINVIPLRGYSTEIKNSKDPIKNGGVIYDKIVLEIRYLINKIPNFNIWTTSFIEGGNISNSYRGFHPLSMNKSFGFGIRSFCYPIGFLGVDFIFPIDSVDKKPFKSKWKTKFIIGKDS
ncbi:BamA/OMP85 family outer membrane protein [Blattabacterium cuenoti]|uniref:BamA/OMP85 family outer membrane protein n=1 Tax=Blattabacterium cuenoti TaxID=1653831 RepID=UPI00163C7743|nr:POTRA domain-containing protein [Blattabacterium cuenoti]